MGSDGTRHLKALAARLLPCLELSSLGEDNTPARIETLCRRAVTPFGHVAAVCVYPRFVAQAKDLLGGTQVRVAAVINFPGPSISPREASAATQAAIAAGADEIDLVGGWARYWSKQRPAMAAHLVIWRTRDAANGKPLDVILETDLLRDKIAIAKASIFTVDYGADFLKTSMVNTGPAATLDAAETMLEVIRGVRGGPQLGILLRRVFSARKKSHVNAATDDEWLAGILSSIRYGRPWLRRRCVGFKAGEVCTLIQAKAYVDLAERIMGRGYVQPVTFRIGASTLLDEVLAILENRLTLGNGASY